MATLFTNMIEKGLRSGQAPARTEKAREWYRETAAKIKTINEKSFFKGDPSRLVSNPVLGSMYMFFYYPKHAQELPYYDTFPLVFPFEKADGGFLGLNMHYLPPQLRANLMDGLYEYANNTKYDERTKLQLNYGLMKKVAKISMFEPCVKRYLKFQMRSKFMYIAPTEWDIALFLPTERFQKATTAKVWKDSKKQIRG
jgi:hypothetical protein